MPESNQGFPLCKKALSCSSVTIFRVASWPGHPYFLPDRDGLATFFFTRPGRSGTFFFCRGDGLVTFRPRTARGQESGHGHRDRHGRAAAKNSSEMNLLNFTILICKLKIGYLSFFSKEGSHVRRM